MYIQGSSNVFCYRTRLWYGNHFLCFPNILEEYFSIAYLYFSMEWNIANTGLQFLLITIQLSKQCNKTGHFISSIHALHIFI